MRLSGEQAIKRPYLKWKSKVIGLTNHLSSLHIRCIFAILEQANAASGSHVASVAKRWSHNVTISQSRKMRTSFFKNIFHCPVVYHPFMMQSYIVKVIFQSLFLKTCLCLLLFAEQYKLLMDHIEKMALEWSERRCSSPSRPADGAQARRPAHWSWLIDPALSRDNSTVTYCSKHWLRGNSHMTPAILTTRWRYSVSNGLRQTHSMLVRCTLRVSLQLFDGEACLPSHGNNIP